MFVVRDEADEEDNFSFVLDEGLARERASTGDVVVPVVFLCCCCCCRRGATGIWVSIDDATDVFNRTDDGIEVLTSVANKSFNCLRLFACRRGKRGEDEDDGSIQIRGKGLGKGTIKRIKRKQRTRTTNYR